MSNLYRKAGLTGLLKKRKKKRRTPKMIADNGDCFQTRVNKNKNKKKRSKVELPYCYCKFE